MKSLVVFTNRGLDRLLEEGGSQAWKLDPGRVRKLTYILCVQNRNDGDWGRPTHDQGEGFLIGRISGVEVSTEYLEDTRYIVKFDEYAEISVPKLWEQLGGLRNPVHYIDNLEKYLDVTELKWAPVNANADGGLPSAASPSPTKEQEPQGLDIADAKKALSAHYQVPVTAIEIIIRG